MENERLANTIRARFELFYLEFGYFLRLTGVLRNWYLIPLLVMHIVRKATLYTKTGEKISITDNGLMGIIVNPILVKALFLYMTGKQEVDGKVSGGIISFNFAGRTLKFVKNKLAVDTFRLINENFLVREYSPLDVAGKNVIDMGASIGDTAILFTLNGARHVYAFEPEPEIYDTMVKNIKLNGLEDKITPVNAAGGDSGRNKYGLSYSLHDTIKKIKSGPIVLKSDCEGCEYKFILNAPKELLERIDSGIMEFHNGSSNLKDKLEKAGFRVKILHVYSSKNQEGQRTSYGLLHFNKKRNLKVANGS